MKFVSALALGLDPPSFLSRMTQYYILFCALKKKKDCYCNNDICVTDDNFFCWLLLKVADKKAQGCGTLGKMRLRE